LLAKPCDSITVGQIIRFVDGGRNGKGQPRSRDTGPFAELWRTVNESVSNVVDNTSFGDLVRQWREREGKYVPNWDI